MNEPVGLTPEAPFGELAPLASRAGVRTQAFGTWRTRLWSAVLSYFPVAVMAVLAAASWWLVKNTPVPVEADARRVARHEPDYTMNSFSIVGYAPDGSFSSRLEGDVLRHFPDTETVEVDRMAVRVVDSTGRVTLASADRALSNRDATQLRLMGNARVVREPGPGEAPDERLEIRGEFLELLSDAERVKSHLPVIVITPRGEIRAGNLDYAHLERSGQLGGRVHGELRGIPRAGP